MAKNKAILLARVSTPEQEKTGLSIEEVQLPQMREYAIENDIELVKEFVFQETASGHKVRQKLNELVEYVKKHHEIKIILGYRVDRITRNFRDAATMDLLRLEYDKELHFVQDRLVLTKDSRGRDIENWDTKVYLAKQHLNRCEEDGYNTYQTKLKSGHSYGHAPYGYNNIKKVEGTYIPPIDRITINEFEAGIVTKVFDLYTTGADSYRSIADKISKTYNIEFGKRKVELILKNPFYAGYRIHNNQRHQHIFPPIISEDTFDLAEEKREGRTKSENNGKLHGKLGLYRGLITCADCGCSYTPSPNRHTKLGREVESESYYYCTNSKHKHKVKPKGTNDKELTAQFAELFKSIQIPQEELTWLTDVLRSSHEGKKIFNKAEIVDCRTQIDKLTNRIEGAYEDKLDGSITTDKYEELRAKWNKQKKKHEDRLERISQADEEYYITSAMLLELASRSYELFMGSEPEQKRQLITLALQNLTIKDGKLQYDWIKPFDSIFNSAKSHEWGRWWKLVISELINLQ